MSNIVPAAELMGAANTNAEKMARIFITKSNTKPIVKLEVAWGIDTSSLSPMKKLLIGKVGINVVRLVNVPIFIV